MVQTVGKGSAAEGDTLPPLHLDDNSRCPAARRLSSVTAADRNSFEERAPASAARLVTLFSAYFSTQLRNYQHNNDSFLADGYTKSTKSLVLVLVQVSQVPHD